MSAQAPFPALRAGYLRAVARAWNDDTYLRELLAASATEPRGALHKLERDFNFNFPYNVKFVISDNPRPIWHPVGTSGWYGFLDQFTIWLPNRPARSEDRTAVLARYSAEFPSMLGKGLYAATVPEDFAEFGVVTSRLIALAWSDQRFADNLYKHRNDAARTIQDAMDYMVPWNFLLKFNPVPGESSDTDEYWNKFPPTEILVHMPQRPDLEVQPIALAAYNNTGGQYPFTCG